MKTFHMLKDLVRREVDLLHMNVALNGGTLLMKTEILWRTGIVLNFRMGGGRYCEIVERSIAAWHDRRRLITELIHSAENDFAIQVH